MNAPLSHDPAKVQTADGAIWLRAAVTTAGRGLYALEGVTGCPRHVLATLPELAEHGVHAVVPDLATAVAEHGPFPMPVGEDDDSHEAKVAEYLSTPYTDDTGAAGAEALAAVDRSIAAQFPAITAFLAEDPHDSPLHSDYATPHDLPEIPVQRDRRAGL